MEKIYIRPKYDINNHEKYAKIIYNEREYIFDTNDFLMILNYEKNFIFHNEDDDYPTYNRHNNTVSFLEFIYKFTIDSILYTFKNDNKYDLRRNNVEFYHKYHKIIIEKYSHAVYNEGHYSNMGKDAYIMKNPYWKINENKEEIYLMYCKTDTLIKIDEQALNKIRMFEKENNNDKNLTFYKQSNGYISTTTKQKKILFIHQIITGCYGNGKGTKNISIDHIDQDPLNNCFNNLRIASRLDQEKNSKGIKESTKRERKSSAKQLPEGLTQDMMRKYVVYYKECYNREKDLYREFFKIEKHPKLGKIWMSSKSGKVSLLDKLAQANKVIDDLEDNIQPEEKKTLPPYISIANSRGKPHLIFDKRCEITGKRLNVKMVLLPDYNLEAELQRLNDKINEKYKIEV